MVWEPEIEELARRRALAAQGGTPDRIDRQHAQAARHTQMQDQRAGVEAKQKVFSAPVDAVEPLTCQAVGQFHWPTQSTIPD